MKEGGDVVVLGLTPAKLTVILVTLISATLFMMYASQSNSAAFVAAFLPQPQLLTLSPAEDNGESSKLQGNEAASALVPHNRSCQAGKREGWDLTNQVENETCSYVTGRWVADERRPLYSGANCKKWLSRMWACRLTQRTNFAYEKFRWLPKNCQVEEFNGFKFLQRMHDKTIAFIGDSLGRQQFQSLMCMIMGDNGRHHVIDVGQEYDLLRSHTARRPDGWAYRFSATNTTIIFYWSACLCNLVQLKRSNLKSKVAMHLDQPPSFLQRFLHKFDILVLNTGHHWNRAKFKANRWVMHIGGIRNKNTNDVNEIEWAMNFTLHSTIKWVDAQFVQYPNLLVFYRSISPRHFSNGEWYNGGTCDNKTPLSRGREVAKYEPRDVVAAKAVRGTNVRLLDITALSELRDEGHISKYGLRPKHGVQDCLHWCLPGIPDAWNEILFAQLKATVSYIE